MLDLQEHIDTDLKFFTNQAGMTLLDRFKSFKKDYSSSVEINN